LRGQCNLPWDSRSAERNLRENHPTNLNPQKPEAKRPSFLSYQERGFSRSKILAIGSKKKSRIFGGKIHARDG
jgi:hypothetical protein